jgi:hypothetical protein
MTFALPSWSARRLLADGTPAGRVLEELAYALTSRSLHLPLQALGQASATERGELQALLHHVYGLPDGDVQASARYGAGFQKPMQPDARPPPAAPLD